MAKDPAFLFYPGDFNTGTQFFTDEQVGKYIRLLMAQHQHGHLEEKHMLFICKTYDKDIFSKFEQDSDKKYFNQRLEDEIVKRVNFSKSRSKNRKSKINTSSSYVNHMENENENKNRIINKDENVDENLWTEIVKSFDNDFRWREKFCRDKNVRLVDYEKKTQEFISELELKEDYKDLTELKRHFTNWFNKNKTFTNGSKTTNKQSPDEKFAARVAYANRANQNGTGSKENN